MRSRAFQRRSVALTLSLVNGAALLVSCAGGDGAETGDETVASQMPTTPSTPSSASGATPTTPRPASEPTGEPNTPEPVAAAEPEPAPEGTPEPDAPAAGGTAALPEPEGSSAGEGGSAPLPTPGGGGSSGAASEPEPSEPNVGGGGAAPVPGGGGAPSEEVPEPVEPLDCGPNAFVIESAGPPSNRVNYVIAGDGYTEAELESTYLDHIAYAMEKRFRDPIGQPYLRYRKFVNICAVKVVSTGGICGNSALGCCGDDQSRLANCDRNAALGAMEDAFQDMPDFDIDWTAVVLNGDSWWNTGSDLMLWSGGNQDAHGAALHEGGHGFHQLADEYDGTDSNCGNEFYEVNSTTDTSDGNPKWGIWVDYDQQPGTGMQGFFEGSRYCSGQQYRPSDNSMMNMLFGDDPNTSYNSVSREKMIFDIWRFVTPVDSMEPPEGDVSDTTVLRVNVVDPEVIDVNWSVDGVLVEEDGGAEFDVASAGPGTHEVTAFAFDNAGEDLVRYREGGEDFGRMNWERSQQEVRWTVTVP